MTFLYIVTFEVGMSSEVIFQDVSTLAAIAPAPSIAELIKRAEALQPLLRKNVTATGTPLRLV
jgi:hypothetical protein